MIRDEADARSWLTDLPDWSAAAGDRLEALVAMLRAENEFQNLVSANSFAQVWRRHIADSAQLLQFVPRETASPWLDLGSGAGFPGLVIAAIRPDWTVIMVESRARRIAWLDTACRALDLDNALVEGARVELVETREVGTISARAFAPLPRLLELSARFSTSNTTWVLPKGRSAQQELDELTGWQHTFHVEQSVTDSDAGIVTGQLHGRNGG